MKNLSLTQQYLLCVLNKNGKLPTFGLDKTLCLSAAVVLESGGKGLPSGGVI